MFLFAFISSFVSFVICIYVQYFKHEISTGFNQNKIKNSLKEHYTWTYLKLWRMKNIFKSCKPVRVWLCFLYKVTKNNYRSIFAGLIQTPKSYRTSLDKISIPTWNVSYLLKWKQSAHDKGTGEDANGLSYKALIQVSIVNSDIWYMNKIFLNKISKKKRLCHHDKNCYFCKYSCN